MTPLRVTILTLFPEMFPGPLGTSLVGKALDQGVWTLSVVSLREYGVGKYNAVDDTCYGGGPGMVVRPDVIDRALQEHTASLKNPRFVYMTPRGEQMDQTHLSTWSDPAREIVILCGRYEGVDERVVQWWGFHQLSLGDFVLCGGELPAMVFLEGCVRLLPCVLGNPDSIHHESFQNALLEYPQYTRPRTWNNIDVPEVLCSGHHGDIERWKHLQSCHYTQKHRPDLWKKYLNARIHSKG